LYNALIQAAINLGWNVAERNNLYRACGAVEIASGSRDIYVDLNNDCFMPIGRRDCLLNVGGPYTSVTTGLNKAFPGDHLFVRTGSYTETPLLDKIMTIQAYDGSVTIGK
jgi:hypothetical protein